MVRGGVGGARGECVGLWCGGVSVWERCCRGECPAFGTEGDNHVGNVAGEGGALFDAAFERCSDSAMLGAYVDGEAGEAFSDEFEEALWREAFKEKREELEF